MNFKHGIKPKNKAQKYYMQRNSTEYLWLIYINFTDYIVQDSIHRWLNNKKTRAFWSQKSA